MTRLNALITFRGISCDDTSLQRRKDRLSVLLDAFGSPDADLDLFIGEPSKDKRSVRSVYFPCLALQIPATFKPAGFSNPAAVVSSLNNDTVRVSTGRMGTFANGSASIQDRNSMAASMIANADPTDLESFKAIQAEALEILQRGISNDPPPLYTDNLPAEWVVGTYSVPSCVCQKGLLIVAQSIVTHYGFTEAKLTA